MDTHISRVDLGGRGAYRGADEDMKDKFILVVQSGKKGRVGVLQSKDKRILEDLGEELAKKKDKDYSYEVIPMINWKGKF